MAEPATPGAAIVRPLLEWGVLRTPRGPPPMHTATRTCPSGSPVGTSSSWSTRPSGSAVAWRRGSAGEGLESDVALRLHLFGRTNMGYR